MKLIEALKNNKMPFGLMETSEFSPKEMQEKAWEIGKKDFQWYGAGWNSATTKATFYSDNTYRLRPDYKEEPEVVEWLIRVPNLEVTLRACHPTEVNTFRTFSYCIEHPDFIGFLYEGFFIDSHYRLFKAKSDGHINDSIGEGELDLHEVLTPTHVLFRGKK